MRIEHRTAHLMASKIKALSARLNQPIASHYGSQFPFWYVIEYPKSGGTWLAQMVSDYLGYPFPQHSLLPVTHKAVLHTHWGYTKNLTNLFYLVRDGRDVMVSFYWMRMRAVKRAQFSSDLAHKRRYAALLGKNFDPDDIHQNLPRFIEEEIRHPRESRINWPDHVGQWWDPDSPNIYCLKYEDLLRDAAGTLAAGFEKFGLDVDKWQLEHSVARFDFERLTGRKPGQVDEKSFLRSGTSGQWKLMFSSEAKSVFDEFCGRVNKNLGY